MKNLFILFFIFISLGTQSAQAETRITLKYQYSVTQAMKETISYARLIGSLINFVDYAEEYTRFMVDKNDLNEMQELIHLSRYIINSLTGSYTSFDKLKIENLYIIYDDIIWLSQKNERRLAKHPFKDFQK